MSTNSQPPGATSIAQVETLFRLFFDERVNAFGREALLAQDEPLRTLLEGLRDRLRGTDPRSTVLPWKSPDKDLVTLFALAIDDAALHELREELRAFLGETFAKSIEARKVTQKQTPIAQAMQAVTGGRVLCIPCDWTGAQKMLRRWVDLKAARPERPRPETRATSLLLRDFDLALQLRDSKQAETVLRSLNEGRRLEALNLIYLRIQQMAAFGEWEAMIRSPDLPKVLMSRRPSSVTDALLRAIYHTHLLPHLATGSAPVDLEPVLSVVRVEVLPSYRTLLRHRVGRGSPEAWTVEALGAFVDYRAAADNPDAGQLQDRVSAVMRACDQLGAWESGVWLADQLRALLPTPVTLTPTPPTEVIAEAERLLIDRRYDESFAIAQSAPQSLTRLKVLLTVADELVAPEVDQTVWAAWEALPAAEADELNQAFHRSLDAVKGRLFGPVESTPTSIPTPVIGGWVALIDFLAATPGETPDGAVQRVQRQGENWLLSREDIAPLLTALNEIETPETVVEVLPYLIQAWERAEALEPVHIASLNEAAQTLLEMVNYPRPEDIQLWVDLLPIVLRQRQTPDRYGRRIKELIELMKRLGGLPPLDGVLDALALLAVSPCPRGAEGLRDQYTTHVVGLARRYASRWAESDRALLRQLMGELGQPELLEGLWAEEPEADRGGPDLWKVLHGKWLGVYTLTPGAAQLFHSMVTTRVPKVRVETNDDEVATERLISLARGADLMFMVTRSATHQATACIEAHRGRKKLLRPDGKGASSLWRALVAEVENPD